MALVNRRLSGSVLLGALCVAGGCQAEYRADARKLDTLWTSGDYEQAAHVAYRDAREESPHRKNRVVYFLEAGRAAQAAGDYPSSIEAFDHAFVDTFPYLDESPEATVSEAIVTTLGNDTMSIYRGTPNDRIMLHAFNALNFMAMGDMSTARIELNRAMLWQDDAHHRYARAIALAGRKNADSVEAAADGWSDDGDSGWSSDSAGVMNGNTRRIMAQHYHDLPNKAAYADYGNPFASHLDGIFRLAVRGYGGDLPAARTGLRNVASMVPQLVPVVGGDIVQASPDSGPLPPTTWVYFLTGQTPEFEEVRIAMPLALSGGFTMPTLALPKLAPNTDMVPWLGVRTDENGSVRSHLLADTAAVARWQFKERLPIIIAQEAVRATGKAVASWAATRFASEQQNLAASLLALGTVLYQVGSAQADLRCWHTLPAEIQVARLPTPATGRLYLSTPDGRDLGIADVAVGESNILVVSMPSNAALAPSLMPIQLTGERAPWVATFDLHADPDAVEDPDTDATALADGDEESQGASHTDQGALDEFTEAPKPVVAHTAIHSGPVMEPAEAAADHPPLPPPPTVDQVDDPPVHDHVSAGALEDPPVHGGDTDALDATDSVRTAAEIDIDTLDVPGGEPQHTHDASSTLNAVASPPTLAPDSTPNAAHAHTAPTTANTRFAVKGVALTWGQAMSWHPKVEHMLDTRVSLTPTATGYMAHNAGDAMLVTSPSALLKDRPVWLHQDAVVAMSDAITRAMTTAGYVGTRVYGALGSPDQLGHRTLHFVVFLPLDAADASVRWPDGLTAVPHPTLPPMTASDAVYPTSKTFQPSHETGPPPNPAAPVEHLHDHDEHVYAGDNAVVDIDAVDDDMDDTHRSALDPAPHTEPHASAPHQTLDDKPIAAPEPDAWPSSEPPTVPTATMAKGPHAVKAIKAVWGRPMEWYPDLKTLLDVPTRLRAHHTGYHAHDGTGPLIVSTPGLLVARQPGWLHPDAMHAMGRALQEALLREGFVGTSVHPACTAPDAKGFVELHLVVFMPLDGTTGPNLWPDHLKPVPMPAPNPTTPPSTPPHQGAPTP